MFWSKDVVRDMHTVLQQWLLAAASIREEKTLEEKIREQLQFILLMKKCLSLRQKCGSLVHPERASLTAPEEKVEDLRVMNVN